MEFYEIIIIIGAGATPLIILTKLFLDHKRFLLKQQNKPIPKEQEITNKLDTLLNNIDQIYMDRLTILKQAEQAGETQTVQSMQGQLKMIQWVVQNKELIKFAQPLLEPVIKTVMRFKF